MDQANKLINSLADNKARWIESSQMFKDTKNRLVGDVAKASAFISYCGPFNADFRTLLNDTYFSNDLKERNIPFTDQFSISDFLVDAVTIGEWALQKLPTDDLSIQNGIMVTRSTRYPLMIDPQGQGLTWIKEREPLMKQYDTVITLNVPNLRESLKMPLENGYPVLIESIENEVDPLLDPGLEKQYIVKGGRKKTIILGGGEPLDFDEKFNLYMTSRLANPHFLPELAAKTTIIDFTVTQGGLEQQLLGRLISFEQKSLEDTLNQLQEEVTSNTKVLADLEASLLDRLANAEGSLLDDVELIDVLANIKIKSREVNDKLVEANEKKIDIGEKREQFRPVAARGSVLYFCIVEMIQINWMYNTSLAQFLDLFYWSISNSQKSPNVKDRVANIIQAMTRKVYRYINRGLFERDKVTFKLMMCFKILIKAGILTAADVGVFLKAGSGIDDRNKKYNWMDQKVWLNIVALSKHKFGNDHSFFYKELPERIGRLEKDWKKFFDENEPENAVVPDFEDKIQADQNLGNFLHMCLIRSVREDRTVLASMKFIKQTLGDYFTQPVTDQLVEIWEESLPNRPVLYLLSAGADPTANIDEFAKKKKQFPTNKVSMGEEQEKPAEAMIVNQGFRDGRWLILNNCHLSLEFMAKMEEVLNPKGKEVHEDFRLWITCQESREFPLGLLQMAIKVTTEPPKGL
jgi:dynein heavy chain